MPSTVSYIKIGNENHPIDAVTVNGLSFTSAEKSLWNNKQDALTFDSLPMEESENPVTSGGVYSAITANEQVAAAAFNDLNDRLLEIEDSSIVTGISFCGTAVSLSNGIASFGFSFDSVPTENSDNLIKSGDIYKAFDDNELVVAAALNNINRRVVDLESGPLVNNEDISKNGQGELQFANRANTNGMGYKILRDGISFASQVTDTNTRYEVRYDFDLGDTSVSIPQGSSIFFVGGSISNGTLQLTENCSITSNECGELDDIAISLLGKNITIENVKITSTVDAIRSDSTDVSGLRVYNCVIEATDDCVKLITDSLSGVLKNVDISKNTFKFIRMGVELQNHSNNNYKINGFKISDNYFIDSDNTTESDSYSTFQSFCYAISLTGYGENGIISGNVFRAVNIGVEEVGFNTITITDNSFIGNQVPISFSNVRQMSNCVITSNRINGGLVRFENIQNSIISGNDFDQIVDVYFKSANGNKITNNRLYALKVGDALFFDNSANNLIKDNTIYHDNASGEAVIKFYGSSATLNISDGNELWRNSSIGTWWIDLDNASNNQVYTWTNLVSGNKIDYLVTTLSDDITSTIEDLEPITVNSTFTDVSYPVSHYSAIWDYNASTGVLLLSFCVDVLNHAHFTIDGDVFSANNNAFGPKATFKLFHCGYDLSNGGTWAFESSDSTNVTYERVGATNGKYYINIIFKNFNGNRGTYVFGHIWTNGSIGAQIKTDRRAS